MLYLIYHLQYSVFLCGNFLLNLVCCFHWWHVCISLVHDIAWFSYALIFNSILWIHAIHAQVTTCDVSPCIDLLVTNKSTLDSYFRFWKYFRNVWLKHLNSAFTFLKISSISVNGQSQGCLHLKIGYSHLSQKLCLVWMEASTFILGSFFWIFWWAWVGVTPQNPIY